MENNEQQKMMQLRMLEQQMNYFDQQLNAIDKAIAEMNELNLGIENLKGSTDKEILAPIGKGIFVKAKVVSEELTVDIGDKNYVKKNIDSTKKIISEQIGKLEDARDEIEKALQEVGNEINMQLSKENSCSCGHDSCSC